jgi:hypothetical protein
MKNGLFCQRDGVEYSVKNEIPDFVVQPDNKFDNVAEIYEESLYESLAEP